MTAFLLDENLSPRIARYLEKHMGLDALPLRHLGQIGISDDEVAELAVRRGRVIITLDSDFVRQLPTDTFRSPGIIWLNPSPEMRSVEKYKQLLQRFFSSEAHLFDLDNSVVEVDDLTSRLIYRLP